mgnify:CR=1 FL=1|jgi:hypothetical protein
MTLTPAQKKIKILIESHGSYEYKQQATIYNFSSSELKRVGYMNDDVRRNDALVGFSFEGIALVRKDDELRKNQVRDFFGNFTLGQGRRPEEGKDWKWQLKTGKRENENYVLIANSELVKKVYDFEEV